MCGISGIVFKKNNVDNHKIICMNEVLNHRGPDSSYLYSDLNFSILSHHVRSTLHIIEKYIDLNKLNDDEITTQQR